MASKPQSNIISVTPTCCVVESTGCQEISPGNCLLFFFAFGSKLWCLSRGEVLLPCESENYTPSSVGSERYQTSSSGRWALFFASFPTTSYHAAKIEPYGDTSHISFGVLRFRAPPLRCWTLRAAVRKQSSTNGQKPGMEFRDPAEKPFCGAFTCTVVCTNTHWATFRAFVPAPFELVECIAAHSTTSDFVLPSAGRDILHISVSSI